MVLLAILNSQGSHPGHGAGSHRKPAMKPHRRSTGIASASKAVCEQFQKSRYFAVQLSCAQRGKLLEKIPLKLGGTLRITLLALKHIETCTY